MFNNISAVCRTVIAPWAAMRRQTIYLCADVYSLRSAKASDASHATLRSASCCVMDLRDSCVLRSSVASRCSAPCGAEWIRAIHRRMRNPCAQYVSRACGAGITVCACSAALVVCVCAELCRCACARFTVCAGPKLCGYACAVLVVCARARLPVCACAKPHRCAVRRCIDCMRMHLDYRMRMWRCIAVCAPAHVSLAQAEARMSCDAHYMQRTSFPERCPHAHCHNLAHGHSRFGAHVHSLHTRIAQPMHCAPHAPALAGALQTVPAQRRKLRCTRTAHIKLMRCGLIPAPQSATAAPDGAQCVQAQNAPQTGANGAKTRGVQQRRGVLCARWASHVRHVMRLCSLRAMPMQQMKTGAKIVPVIGVQVVQILFAFYVAQ